MWFNVHAVIECKFLVLDFEEDVPGVGSHCHHG